MFSSHQKIRGKSLAEPAVPCLPCLALPMPALPAVPSIFCLPCPACLACYALSAMHAVYGVYHSPSRAVSHSPTYNSLLSRAVYHLLGCKNSPAEPRFLADVLYINSPNPAVYHSPTCYSSPNCTVCHFLTVILRRTVLYVTC